jgi:hypothetical protein
VDKSANKSRGSEFSRRIRTKKIYANQPHSLALAGRQLF